MSLDTLLMRLECRLNPFYALATGSEAREYFAARVLAFPGPSCPVPLFLPTATVVVLLEATA